MPSPIVIPEFPFLAKYTFNRGKGYKEANPRINVVVPILKSKNRWRLGNAIPYSITYNDLIVCLDEAYGGTYFFLPLKAILEGLIPKNALIWKPNRKRYPIASFEELDLNLC